MQAICTFAWRHGGSGTREKRDCRNYPAASMDTRKLVALTTNSLAQAVGVGSDQPEGATEPAGAPTGRGTLAGAGRVAWGACWALLGPWMAERDCARHHATVGRARRMCWAMLQNFLLELAKPRG